LVQQSEGKRIAGEIERFNAAVKQYSVIFHARSFFKWATGTAAAYKDIDQASSVMNARVATSSWS
jgi:hypothetical protein